MTKRIAGVALMALVMVVVSQPAMAGTREIQNVDRGVQPSTIQRVLENALPFQLSTLVRILISGPVTTPREETLPVASPIDTTANGVGGCGPRAGVGGCKI